MKNNIKMILSWLLVLLWMSLIFLLSNETGTESLGKSRHIVDTTIETTLKTTNKIGITNKHPSKNKLDTFVASLDIPTRKTMHVVVYLILGILLYNALYNSKVRNKKLTILTILTCFIYAISDEYHQLFRQRTSSYTDVLIDTFGSIIGTSMIYLIKKHKLKKNITKKEHHFTKK